MNIKAVITKAIQDNFSEFTEDQAEAVIEAIKQEGFVLMPKEPTKDTLIEIASICIGDDFANLDEAKELYKAAIKAQEPAND
ncbi:hypothetical protein [Acinetobacter sp. YH12105]|uniref:hypothetical protein n=1 Tax=Acinetobacter sp. YH12105 TaxID=2601093 RepID=UPI0015D1A6DF|nr:hypothetical protein [Acinetobacter sp. YH12105]